MAVTREKAKLPWVYVGFLSSCRLPHFSLLKQLLAWFAQVRAVAKSPDGATMLTCDVTDVGRVAVQAPAKRCLVGN